MSRMGRGSVFAVVTLVAWTAGIARADGDGPRLAEARGIVVDESGRPVAGIEVRAFAFSHLETAGVTGADGSFAFPTRRPTIEGLSLLARSADGARQGFFRYDTVLSRSEAVAPARIVLRPSREVVVRVAGADGNPVAGASVEVSGATGAIASGATDAAGVAALRIPIDARVPWVYALKPGLGFDCAEFGTIDPGSLDRGAPAREIPATIALTLDGARTARIKAVDADGRPVAGVAFSPLFLQKAGHRSPALLGVSRLTLASTDADGVATFDWLPIGKAPITFGTRSEGFSSPRRPLEDFGGTAAEFTARLYRMGLIQGLVRTPDDRPIAGVLVMAAGRGRGADSSVGRARTGADGSYAMAVSSDVAYMVEVDDDEWAAPTRDGVVVREGGPAAEVDFRLVRGTLVRGTVTLGPDRKPAPGRVVRLLERGGPIPKELTDGPRPPTLQVDRIAQTGTDGRFALRVAPGTYTLQGPERTTPETITVADQPEVVHDFAMPRAERGPISGRVVLAADLGRGVAGAKVEGIATTIRAPGRAFDATADADGRFRGERRLDPTIFHAASPDGALAGIVQAGAEDAEVVIPIGPTASVSGQLLDDGGQPAAGRDLECSRPIPDTGGSNSVVFGFVSKPTTDALGRFTLPSLVVGQSYQITVRAGPNGSDVLTIVRPREPGPLDLGALQNVDYFAFRDGPPRRGDPAPPIRATTLDGRPITPDDFRGKYVLIAFWATWCGLCVDDIPALQALQDAFGNDPRFALVVLSVDASIDAPRRFAADHKHPGLQAFVGPRGPGSVADDFNVRVLPTMILVGPDGAIVTKETRAGRIKKAVAEALGKAP